MDTVGESGNRKGRPNYPVDFKRRLATLACESGVSVSKLAQQHGLNVNMLFKWRRDLRSGLLAETEPRSPHLVPVVVQRPPLPPGLPSAMAPARPIEIVIADAVVRISAGTDAALLQLVLQSLRT